MASLPTAACREHNDAAALDATCTHDIEEWAVVDESRMQRTDGARVNLKEANRGTFAKPAAFHRSRTVQ